MTQFKILFKLKIWKVNLKMYNLIFHFIYNDNKSIVFGITVIYFHQYKEI